MNRREFLASAAAAAAAGAYSGVAQSPAAQLPEVTHGFPARELRNEPYIEETPIDGYQWASESAYEAFRDMKFGVRIHWGIYSIWHLGGESWPFLPMSFEDRQTYQSLYKTWNPAGFDAESWLDIFRESGMRMLAFTTKHHEGFCMFDTKTKVTSRANWTAAGGPKMESCDLAYSIMETPFRRDVVKEVCDAARKRDFKIDLYFSHPDWYDADFRPYGPHPLQVPDSPKMIGMYGGPREPNNPDEFWARIKTRDGGRLVIVPDPTSAEVQRMVERHRTQTTELLTQYGKIDMLGFDIAWGPEVWPQLRETVLKLRKLQPDVMFRDRGIGNYGDYFTPEGVVPGSKELTEKPWFTIYPLGRNFSYNANASDYKGTAWIVRNLVSTVAKGGALQVGIGPDGNGEFHPEAIRQMKDAGAWLKVNGEAIYATRPRAGTLWSEIDSEGEAVLYTRSKDRRFVYAILTEWPGTQVTLKSVRPTEGSQVTLLGANANLRWRFDSDQGTIVSIPENLQQASNRPCDYAWSLKFAMTD